MGLKRSSLLGIVCLVVSVLSVTAAQVGPKLPFWAIEECHQLAELLRDHLTAPGWVSQWGDYEYARYVGGRLAQLGYSVFLARAGDSWWVVVRLSNGEEDCFVPVMPGIAYGREDKQPRGAILGSLAGSLEGENPHLDPKFLYWEELLKLPPNAPPIAVIRVPRRNFRVNEVVMLFGVSSFDPDGTIVRFLWDLGDGEREWGDER